MDLFLSVEDLVGEAEHCPHRFDVAVVFVVPNLVKIGMHCPKQYFETFNRRPDVLALAAQLNEIVRGFLHFVRCFPD